MHDDRLEARRAALRSYETKKDREEYELVLRDMLQLFGEGIHESLARTMGDFLDATDGEKSNSKISQLDWDRTSELRGHNNDAERPFAVMKALAHHYPSMGLLNLSHMAHARVNGTFRLAERGGKTAKTKHRAGVEAGSAFTADPRLQSVVSELTSVRTNSLGALTVMARDNHNDDSKAEKEKREKKRSDNKKEAARKMKNRATLANAANEADLVSTSAEFKSELLSRETIASKMKFINLEFDSRVRRGRKYPLIGCKFRSQTKKAPLRKTPGPDSGLLNLTANAYMEKLTAMMVAYDENREFDSEVAEVKGLRELPVISKTNTSAACSDIKANFQKTQIENAKPADDALLVLLDKEYVGKLWLDTEGDVISLGGVRKKRKLTWKVLRISSFDDSYEATSIPVELAADGEWRVYDEMLVRDEAGKTLETHYKKHEWGVIVADLRDPKKPQRADTLDLHIAAHDQKYGHPRTSRYRASQEKKGGRAAREISASASCSSCAHFGFDTCNNNTMFYNYFSLQARGGVMPILDQ
jgi:hypothetical protein